MAPVDGVADVLFRVFARGLDECELRGFLAPAGYSLVRGRTLGHGHQFGVELRREYDSDLAARPELIRKLFGG